MRHAGASFSKNADLVVIHVNEVREPDIASKVVMIRHPLYRSLAEIGEAKLHIGRGLRQMTMDT
jgi:hypothetical protein